jgi:hypothetical protein
VAAGGGGAAEGAGGAAGSDGADGNAPNEGGGAGTPTDGGVHGDASCGAGTDGSLGLGGAGGASTVQQQNGAGGGGAGLYGGGGGGAGCMSGGGGGGGGSSRVPSGGTQTLVSAGAAPQVQFVYSPVPSGPPQPTSNPPAASITVSSKHARMSRAGAISFVIQSNEDANGSATGIVSVSRAAKVLRFRDHKLSLKAGVTTKVTLKLSRRNAKRARAALKHRRHLRATITVRLTNAAGLASTKRFSLRLTA